MQWRFIKKDLDAVRTMYLLAGLVFVTAVGLGLWFGAQYVLTISSGGAERDFVSVPVTAEEPAPPCNFRRRVDGVCVASADKVETKLTAVMIENSADAWPLSGLSVANIVYEVPVEGNIPRFLALYADDVEVVKVGPVRSARPYCLDWLSEYGNPPYLHVGGSPEALEKIDQLKLFGIDEFFRDWYFWRSADRARPHNTYTSSLLWKKARADYEKYNSEKSYDVWTFSDLAACDDTEKGKRETGNEKWIDACVDSVTVPFLSPTYDATWKYVSETGRYERYQNDKKQFDGDVPIEADTVIVERVKMATIDEIGRKRIDTVGTGEAMIFRDGYIIKGTWKKASRTERTQFFDKEGNVIPLKAGKIWVEIISRAAEVEVK